MASVVQVNDVTATTNNSGHFTFDLDENAEFIVASASNLKVAGVSAFIQGDEQHRPRRISVKVWGQGGHPIVNGQVSVTLVAYA
jgi:hypothetical protein